MSRAEIVALGKRFNLGLRGVDHAGASGGDWEEVDYQTGLFVREFLKEQSAIVRDGDQSYDQAWMRKLAELLQSATETVTVAMNAFNQTHISADAVLAWLDQRITREDLLTDSIEYSRDMERAQLKIGLLKELRVHIESLVTGGGDGKG